MTYDSRKSLRGQEYVEEIELVLDACRFTQGLIFTGREVATVGSYNSSYTGAITIDTYTAGWAAEWSGVSPIYMQTATGEIVSITITSDTSITITARSQLGTTADTITGDLKVMHQGEADGTCVGFPHNCSSSDSYDANVKLRMIFSTAQNAGGVRRFPGLFHGKVRHDAGEVDVGESIGSRSMISFSIADQVHNDHYVVPYPERRTSAGTMFGKLFARHPYMVGREVLYREGYRTSGTFTAPDFVERTFIIDRADLSKGLLSVNALDPLILTEDKKAKMPLASPMRLSAAITGTPATFNYIDAPDYYAGPMSSTVYLAIDSEIIKATVSGAKQFTVVTRGYRSESKDHDARATIQDCAYYSATHGIDIIEDALTNYTSIPAAYIGSYAAVKALLPSFTFFEVIIPKPTAVVDVINQFIKLGNLIFYFDQVSGQIVINYIPELEVEPILIDESEHIERDSVSIDQNVRNQWTRHAIMFGPVNATKDSEENYAVRFLAANLPLEADGQLGEINEKKEFKCPLLTTDSGDSLIATSYVDRVLSNTEQPPKVANLKINAKDVGATQGGTLSLGSIVSLSTFESQDKNGSPVAELYQVLKLSGNGYADYNVKMRRYQATAPETIDFTISTNKTNYDLSSEFAPAAGSYTVYISPGVVIGSTSTATPAFSTGTQAAGVSFTIINRGSILGMGGRGGDASTGTASATGNVGNPGGPAFNATVDCTIENGSGLIWAGGGGGAGDGGNINYRYGGGGGQGFSTSSGGANTYKVVNPPDPDIWSPDGTSGPSGGQSSSGGGPYPGGSWGQAGTAAIKAGGSGGFSVVKNGNTVTFTSGDNALNVKGAKI